MEIIDGDWGCVATVVAVSSAVATPNPVSQNTKFAVVVQAEERQVVTRPWQALCGEIYCGVIW